MRKALIVLQSILKLAVEREQVVVNAAAAVSKPSSKRIRTVVVLAPETVEALRTQLDIRDATLVSVLAYSGLRPGEALGLRWGDIGERTIRVERSVSYGEVKSTKTNRARTVDLLVPLAADLAEWRMACGRPPTEGLVFPRRDGTAWLRDDWKNWRTRTFDPATKAIGLDGVRPYDLRHAFCSLLIHEGMSVIEVAEQAEF